MTSLFSELVAASIDEFRRRHRDYLMRYAIASGAFRAAASEYTRLPRYGAYAPEALDEIASSVTAQLDESGLPLDRTATTIDPIGRVLLESAIDAFAAARGDLAIRPAPLRRPQDTIAEVMRRGFERKTMADGVRYFVARHGTRPLVLTTATGIAGSVWLPLLADRTHPFRPIVVESRCGDCVRGGIVDSASAEGDAADIAAVLDAESLDRVHVVGWCNGCHIAIELARRLPERVTGLVLLSPTLWDVSGRTRGSAYQDEMYRVFAAVARNPAIAQTCAAMFTEELAASAPERASPADLAPASLLALPDARLRGELALPTSDATMLVHYARRMMTDAAYQLPSVLAGLSTPTMVVTGTHDHIVSDAITWQTLGSISGIAGFATVTGAGHYILDLQYAYLRWLLERFLCDGEVPASAARVRTRQPHRIPAGVRTSATTSSLTSSTGT